MVVESDDPVAAKTDSFTSPTCEVANMAPGRYNFTLVVTSSAGAGLAHKKTISRVNGDDVFDLAVFPTMGSLSTHQSGLLGGQLLTITGTGFSEEPDCANVEVDIAGVACSVESCTMNSLTCRVGTADSMPAAPFEGPRGLLYSISDRFDSSDYTNSTFSGGYQSISRNIRDNYVQRVTNM